jgi:deoxycytidylate deaminase
VFVLTSHPCLRAQVECHIQRREPLTEFWVTLAVGRNSCQSQAGPRTCARDEVGANAGEQYDLCGPPLHAEEDALRQLDVREVRPGDMMRAIITGQDWLCRNCQKMLFDAGVRTFVVKG